MTLDDIRKTLCKGEHSSFNLQWNENATFYVTAAEAMADNEDYYLEDNFVGGAVEKALCAETNSIWTAHWYPETPVGFCVLHAATYEKLHAALEALCGKESDTYGGN